MTPDDMTLPSQPGDDSLDERTAEGILCGDLPSGDAALDAALDALRVLGQDPAPEPVGELAVLLTSGASGTPGASGGGSAVPRPADELGRRRQGHARHVATGTTAVAGILLVTATAAAAIGGFRAERAPASPTLPPAVVVHPGSPHPAGTTPSRLPVVPPMPAATGGLAGVGADKPTDDHADDHSGR